ncbi:hypothetical protein OBBRIDRAFT_831765 [Obba rivulosa]|uniref:Uncharacterized protein n=1 Tax=Obba rivulosa TaxID=1052685 RepID=A0A8E2DRT8_9APHY|nr:hypothetical protein OBBRIDRAFT_831765 [Obba rivulosa]
MNGGQNSASSINNDQLSLIPANGVLSPEEYLRVQQQLDQVKQRIQLVEQNNKIALQKYLAQRAQEGREAERMLAQIRAGEHSQPTATPALPVNPSATVSPDLAYGDGYSATSPVVQTQPTATITEVQSPQQLAQAPLEPFLFITRAIVHSPNNLSNTLQ